MSAAAFWEVGPGIGPLTNELCRAAKKVLAVEVDTSLQPILAETMAGNENLEILFRDILKTDIPALVREEFRDCGRWPARICHIISPRPCWRRFWRAAALTP